MKKYAILAAAMAACLTVTGCGAGENGSAAAEDDNTLIVFNYGDYIERSVLDMFEEETGIKVGFPDASQTHFYVREGDVVWNVHPFLYKVSSDKVELNSENTDFVWVDRGKVSCDGLVDGVERIVKNF